MRISAVFLVVTIIILSLGTVAAAQLFAWDDLFELEGPSGDFPLIIIHGYYPEILTEGLLHNIIERNWRGMLEKLGVCPVLKDKLGVYVFYYQPEQSIPGIARELAREIEEHLGPEQKFIILSHSMGGIISRYYMTYLEEGEQVLALLALATPNKGIPAPVAGTELNPAIKNLQGTPELMRRLGFSRYQGGSFLQELNEVDGNHERYYFFSSFLGPGDRGGILSYLGRAYYSYFLPLEVPSDGIVPTFSVCLGGARNFPPLKGVDHNTISESPEMMDLIMTGLRSILDNIAYPVFGQVVDEEGQGVPNVRLEADGRKYYTDEDGYFSLEDQYFGTQIFPRVDNGVFLPPYLTVDGREGPYNFAMKSTIQVAGRVKDYWGQSVRPGSIIIMSNTSYHEYYYETVLGPDGEFSLDSVAPGNYRFLLVRENWPVPVLQSFELTGPKMDLMLNIPPQWGDSP